MTGDTSTSWGIIWGGDAFGRGSSIELHCMKILIYDFAHMQTQLSNENSASTINSFLYFSSLVSSCENIPSLSLKIMPCLSISFIKALRLLIFVNVIPKVKIMNYFASLSLFNRKWGAPPMLEFEAKCHSLLLQGMQTAVHAVKCPNFATFGLIVTMFHWYAMGASFQLSKR